jgi:hypothetical protein
MTSLAEELPAQQERCRQILENALAIGPAGTYLATMLRASLARAERAAAAGDVTEMIRAVQDLRGYES